MTRMTLRMVSALSLTVLLLIAALPGAAQTPEPIRVQVDRTALSTDDVLILSVTLDAVDGTFPQFTLPPLDGFIVVGSSTSSQTTIINGAVSANVVYTYRLQPLQAGDWTIPALSLTAAGQTYATPSIAITVTQGTGSIATASGVITPPAPAGNADYSLFVEAEVDNSTPYIGEQVRYTFRFYRAVTSIGSPDYEGPDFAGFWANEEIEQNEYMTRASNGQTYRVIELSKIIFPTAAGENTIKPAILRIPGSFFSQGTILQTDPITLKVKALPAGAPADFTGAVGHYQISETLDAANTRVGEPVSMRIAISGQGNINALPEPIWLDSAEWRMFDDGSTTQVNVQNGVMTGTRLFERLLIPKEAGQFASPTISYSYFDPAIEAYQTISTNATDVLVAPGDPNAVVYDEEPDTTKDPAAPLTGLSELKPTPDTLFSSAAPLQEQPLYVALWILPLSILGIDVLITARQRYLDRNAAKVRFSRAYRRARWGLRRLLRSRGDKQLEVRQILVTYLEDKIQEPVNGLTVDKVAALLNEKGLSRDLVEQVRQNLLENEHNRFGQIQIDNTDNIIQHTQSVISGLEKELAQ